MEQKRYLSPKQKHSPQSETGLKLVIYSTCLWRHENRKLGTRNRRKMQINTRLFVQVATTTKNLRSSSNIVCFYEFKIGEPKQRQLEVEISK